MAESGFVSIVDRRAAKTALAAAEAKAALAERQRRSKIRAKAVVLRSKWAEADRAAPPPAVASAASPEAVEAAVKSALERINALAGSYASTGWRFVPATPETKMWQGPGGADVMPLGFIQRGGPQGDATHKLGIDLRTAKVVDRAGAEVALTKWLVSIHRKRR